MAVRLDLRNPAWLLLFLLAGFILNTGNVPLFDVDEGAFSEATREMLDSGIWSATYLDGAPRYDKPILTYWLQAFSVQLFGLNEWALRLHAMLCALLWGAAIYSFGREMIDRRSAAAAVMIFSTTLLVSVIGRSATADALLNLLIALSLFDIYRYALRGERRHLWRCWLWIGLGMLTKGPVAAAIPFISSLVWFGSYGRYRDWLRAVADPVGWLILLLIVSPWLYFVWLEQGSDFFRGFLVEHNLNRFTQTTEGHGGHWYYYLLVLPLMLLPYAGMLVLLRHFRALWRRPLERLLLIWFLCVFVLVSASQTQLPHYVLYGVTPLLLLFSKYRRVYDRQHWQWLFPALFCLLPLGFAVTAERLSGWQDNAYLAEMLAMAPRHFDGVFLGLTLALCLAFLLVALTRLPLWQKLTAAGLLQTLFIFTLLTPAIAALQQQPVKEAALMAKELDRPFIAYRIDMPSFSLYRQAVTPRGMASPGDYLFTRSDRLPDLYQAFGQASVHILYRQGGIVLAHIAAVPDAVGEHPHVNNS